MAEAASQGAPSSSAALSLTRFFLLPQTCSWTGPLRKHPKVRRCGGLPQPGPILAPRCRHRGLWGSPGG